MTDIDRMQRLVQEKLAELTILQDKLEKAVEEEENAKRIQEETEKWYAEENEKAIREAEQKRLLDEEKKVQDAIEKRRLDAEAMETITLEQARDDLFTNKETPFVFMKYLHDFAKTIFRPVNWAYMSDEEWNAHVYERVGRNVQDMICADHRTRTSINPSGHSAGRGGWTYNHVKSSLGPCQSWSGHAGYCWEGTYDTSIQGTPQAQFRR